MQNKNCWVCGSTYNIHKHHIFGGRNRKMSDKYDMTVNLCQNHHTGLNGVHFNKLLDIQLKQQFQTHFEALYGHEKFMKIFGRNYLESGVA